MCGDSPRTRQCQATVPPASRSSNRAVQQIYNRASIVFLPGEDNRAVPRFVNRYCASEGEHAELARTRSRTDGWIVSDRRPAASGCRELGDHSRPAHRSPTGVHKLEHVTARVMVSDAVLRRAKWIRWRDSDWRCRARRDCCLARRKRLARVRGRSTCIQSASLLSSLQLSSSTRASGTR